MAQTEARKAWVQANKEKIREYQKWYRQNVYIPSKREDSVHHKYNLKSKYGITVEDYDKMFAEQHGCCAICNRHQTEFKNRLAVDHCHTTNKVRKLLCNSCNTLIGHAKESIPVLERAIQYLKDTGHEG